MGDLMQGAQRSADREGGASRLGEESPAGVHWTMTRVMAATRGSLVGGVSAPRLATICTDTRHLQPNDVFVALVGDRFDGHAFVDEAVKKGAAAVIVNRIPTPMPSVSVIVVDDTLKALGDLAAFRRRLLPNLKVIAITGSCGKTTVKEMTAAILASRFRLLKTKGNFNNLVGLPLCLLQVEEDHEVAVLEMGMNRPGEIARLTEIAGPDIACITNVRPAHLEGVHDIEGVARAKGELFFGVKPGARLVVNLDDPNVEGLTRNLHQEMITFGLDGNAEVRATQIQSLGARGMLFSLRRGTRTAQVHMKAVGIHNVTNAMAAAALAYAVGADFDTIVEGLESFVSCEQRLCIRQTPGVPRIVNDSYNANPASVAAALMTLKELKGGNKAVAVLGDMLELGAHSIPAHRGLGEEAGRLGLDYLFAVGKFAPHLVAGARSAGMSRDQAMEFVNKEEIFVFLEGLRGLGRLQEEDWILVKGSHGMHMETLVEELVNAEGDIG